jgi:integrase
VLATRRSGAAWCSCRASWRARSSGSGSARTRCGPCASRGRGAAAPSLRWPRRRSRRSGGEMLARGRFDGATLLSLLAYAGLRPEEALALLWRHVRERTLVIEQAVSDGELKGQKTGRPPDGRSARAAEAGSGRVAARVRAASAGRFSVRGASRDPWRGHDYRNRRRRHFEPAAKSAGLDKARPYRLRHRFASVLLHEGRSRS